MRIALIRNHDLCENTRQLKVVQRRAGVLPHLGLGYIQTALKRAGYQTRLFDAQALAYSTEQLKAALEKFQPHLVGVTTTTPGFPGALEACKAAKSVGAIVILGGPHSEVFTRENLVHPEIDFVGVGEGITIMPALASALDEGALVRNIPGLVGRDFENPPAAMVNLADAGWPNRDDVTFDRYYSIMANRPFATMISSRGCPFQCSFCFKQAVDKRSIFRSPQDVVDEMAYLRERWGVREIMFYDDVFTMKRKRVLAICDEIRRRDLRVGWEAPTRVDLVDPELLQAMRSAGCVRLRFGIESGSPSVLEHMRKSTDLRTIGDAVKAAAQAGIQTFAYFIVGYLNEARDEFERTIDLALTLPLDYASFYAATPLPGTRLFKDAVTAGLVAPDYWLKFVQGPVHERIGYLVPDAEERAREAYRRFYLRPKMAGTLMKHMLKKRMFFAISSGLASLILSRTNAVRDI